MKPRQIALPDDLDAALTAMHGREGALLRPDDVTRAPLREYLTARGYVPPKQPLRITPAIRGSGFRDISVDHDRYLAEE